MDIILNDAWLWVLVTTGLKQLLIAALGGLLGLLLCITQLFLLSYTSIQQVLNLIQLIIRLIPQQLVLFALYYSINTTNIFLNTYIVAVGSLGLVCYSYMYQSICEIYHNLVNEYNNPCISLGLSKYNSVFHIYLPQALLFSAPQLANILNNTYKNTVLLNLIGIEDVFNIMQTAGYATGSIVQWIIFGAIMMIIGGYFINRSIMYVYNDRLRKWNILHV